LNLARGLKPEKAPNVLGQHPGGPRKKGKKAYLRMVSKKKISYGRDNHACTRKKKTVEKTSFKKVFKECQLFS